LFENLFDKIDTKLIRAVSSKLQQKKPQSADLRELENYLQLIDSKHSLADLVTTDGHRRVCFGHYNAISFN
jgi:hypothetical protein